ncbi:MULTISPECIES: hypothetical protein [Brevundimonas]|uniref:hypothetical protein n=1 Tax=Brevundimonas TaxID=41275 RepID=UPI003208FBA5
MKRRPRTVEDIEDFAERLDGPLGAALHSTGIALERRLREEGLAWADLDDDQVAHLFLTAFLEAAPAAYPHLEREYVEQAVQAMAANVRMELAANAGGSDAWN